MKRFLIALIAAMQMNYAQFYVGGAYSKIVLGQINIVDYGGVPKDNGLTMRGDMLKNNYMGSGIASMYLGVPFLLVGLTGEIGYSDLDFNNSNLSVQNSSMFVSGGIIAGIRISIFRIGLLFGVHGQNYSICRIGICEGVTQISREWEWSPIIGICAQFRMPMSLIDLRFYQMSTPFWNKIDNIATRKAISPSIWIFKVAFQIRLY